MFPKCMLTLLKLAVFVLSLRVNLKSCLKDVIVNVDIMCYYFIKLG